MPPGLRDKSPERTIARGLLGAASVNDVSEPGRRNRRKRDTTETNGARLSREMVRRTRANNGETLLEGEFTIRARGAGDDLSLSAERVGRKQLPLLVLSSRSLASTRWKRSSVNVSTMDPGRRCAPAATRTWRQTTGTRMLGAVLALLFTRVGFLFLVPREVYQLPWLFCCLLSASERGFGLRFRTYAKYSAPLLLSGWKESVCVWRI